MPVLCGCYHNADPVVNSFDGSASETYLPLLSCEVHATILSTTTRTEIQQTFRNPSPTDAIKECAYVFPLYDGVSVVEFTCRVGSRTIRGIVKEKASAKADYEDAVSRGETAALLVQLPRASDAFSTRIGSIPANESVTVEITCIGELEHDTGFDAIRYTLPTNIMPRYGPSPTSSDIGGPRILSSNREGGIKITVDINMADGINIEEIKCPTYDAITLSTNPLSAAPEKNTGILPILHQASVSLTLEKTSLEKDFVLLVKAKETTVPKAISESHPRIQGQRALMVTLVPRFSLPTSPSEIIFIVDRSESMKPWMPTLISAMKVSLKSLSSNVSFNICSFGSTHSFLWPESRQYSQDTLNRAMAHAEGFKANMRGTEIYDAIQATFKKLSRNHPCEIMLLTDGEYWDSDSLCNYISSEVTACKGNIRLFSLGIGDSVSSALIQGVARAGNGFAQNVEVGTNMDTKVMRMLKGAMSPHVTDYSLQIKYAEDSADGFEHTGRSSCSLEVEPWEPIMSEEVENQGNKAPPIPLFDMNVDPDKKEPAAIVDRDRQELNNLSLIFPPPDLLQAPSKVPPLFPFLRTTIYLLMSPETIHKRPISIILRGSWQGQDLEQEVPIDHLPEVGETLHQLAAKKAIQELEQGRGWIYDAREKLDDSVKDRISSRFEEMVKEEAVRLGVQFQVAGKWCSFVAVSTDTNTQEPGKLMEDDDYIILDNSNVKGSTPEQVHFRACSALPPGRSAMPVCRFASSAGSHTRGGPVYRGVSSPRSQTKGGPVYRGASSSRSYTRDTRSAGGDSRHCELTKSADDSEEEDMGFGFIDDVKPVINPSLSDNDRLHRIIFLQDFEGFWQSSADLISLVNDTITSEALAAAGSDRKRITMLVVEFLQTKMLSLKEVWESVVEKAIKWQREKADVQADLGW